MLQSFLSFIEEKQLLPHQAPTLLAVSGGVDSVVMSALFHRAKLSFAIAHCNFGLRSAAEQDEAFVRALAQQYGVPYYTQALDARTHAQAAGLSIQMAARTLRYAWFESLCSAHRFEKVATAHHINDSLETVLLHLTKGTGIAGLHGILPAQGSYIRPLLFADKAAIYQYAHSEGLAWREDSSNDKNDYQRNLIRNRVVPLLKEINPGLETTFRLTTARLGQTEALFKEQLASLRQQVCREQGPYLYIAIQAIQDHPWAPVVVWEWLKHLGFSFARLQALLTCPHDSGTMLQATHHCLYVDRAQWIVAPWPIPQAGPHTIEAVTQSLALPNCMLQCTQIPKAAYAISTDLSVAALDRAQLQFPLTVRRWQPGDMFYPLGMEQRKKVSDFLIDCKVPLPLKEQVWVMTSNEEIVWVVGYRIDNRYKLTAHTAQVYEMRQVMTSLIKNTSNATSSTSPH